MRKKLQYCVFFRCCDAVVGCVKICSIPDACCATDIIILYYITLLCCVWISYDWLDRSVLL